MRWLMKRRNALVKKTSANDYHAQLGLPDKDRTIKGLFDSRYACWRTDIDKQTDTKKYIQTNCHINNFYPWFTITSWLLDSPFLSRSSRSQNTHARSNSPQLRSNSPQLRSNSPQLRSNSPLRSWSPQPWSPRSHSPARLDYYFFFLLIRVLRVYIKHFLVLSCMSTTQPPPPFS